MSTIVVGAGIVGASTAFELAQRGHPVTLVDRGGVATETTGLGEGNVLAGDKDAGPELELTVAGLAVYRELEDRLGAVAGIRRKGSLIVHPDARTWAAEPARMERLAGAGVAGRLVEPGEVRALEPALTGPVQGASHFPDDLQCDPRGIARALARRAQALGGDVRTDALVDEIALDGGRVAGVRVAGELLAADTVVLAAGPWSAPLAGGAGLPLPVAPRKGQLARVRLPEPDEQFLRHKLVDGDYLLSVASAADDRQISTVVETTADGAVIVGSSRERAGFDLTVDLDLAAAMRARAARLIPALASCPIDDVWVGFRPWLPDHLPAIGASRAVPGLVVGTGHEGSGVALGPVTGRLLAQVICGEEPAVDLAPFDPDRFA
ncbi:MAG TPA: FAD-binding oxidoreductase [Solirubrobacteraceae bacterium]|nr:FAD-binding oxidoreductase [Solirubrobacteraceae bacterium]